MTADTKAIDDGGPAYPTMTRFMRMDPLGNTEQVMEIPHHGMSLRDWLAGQALDACIAHHTLECRTRSTMPDYHDGAHREAVAMLAYSMADAMIAVRNKP